MNKPGGGRGTNQPQVDGNAQVPVSEPEPDINGMFYGTATVFWDESTLEPLVSQLSPKGVVRALNRFQERMGEQIFSDAFLEGNTFTRPEVETLLHGRHVPGHTEGEEAMVKDLHAASECLLDLASVGPVALTQAVSDDLHLFLARNTPIPTLSMRADYDRQNTGPKVNLGGGLQYQSLGRDSIRQVFDQGVERISAIEHPVLRGTVWAAFATYHQFYLDGNKRTGRYVMNAILTSHGYDAIIVPDRAKDAYLDAVIASYKHHDLTPHIEFLISLYSD